MPDEDGVLYENEPDPDAWDPDFPTVDFNPTPAQLKLAAEALKLQEEALSAGEFKES
jgi:hypothetical protein